MLHSSLTDTRRSCGVGVVRVAGSHALIARQHVLNHGAVHATVTAACNEVHECTAVM
jgi:hypothetical protein